MNFQHPHLLSLQQQYLWNHNFQYLYTQINVLIICTVFLDRLICLLFCADVRESLIYLKKLQYLEREKKVQVTIYILIGFLT